MKTRTTLKRIGRLNLRALVALEKRLDSKIDRLYQEEERLSDLRFKIMDAIAERRLGIKMGSTVTYKGHPYEVRHGRWGKLTLERVDAIGSTRPVAAPRLTEWLKGKSPSPFKETIKQRKIKWKGSS